MSRRAIWPLLHRIRARCGVEMALDRCVQKLRRKVAHENHASDTVARTGRVPSFYTTRSIVNLSGLSVSDPLSHPLNSSEDLSAYTSMRQGAIVARNRMEATRKLVVLCIGYT